jgi:hypothetical protein
VLRRLLFALALATPLALAPARASADDDDEKPKAYFYKGYDYGSQALFNPVTMILNRGFDIFQLHPHNSDIRNQDWGTNFGNVLDNVSHPYASVHREGNKKFLREEIFPLTWGIHGARWAPNYGLHLIGGGQTYAQLTEWYRAHDVPMPALLAIANLYTAALINESLENDSVRGDNTDCLADLLVFDALGIILFSSESVREFFSEDIIVSDWSLQPSFSLPSGDLRNVGNYYALKWPLPFYERLRLFGYLGMSTLGGLSYVLERGYSVSVAGGAKVDSFYNAADGQVTNVISAQPAAAVFVDRNDSALLSLQVSGVQYDYARLNVFPNAFYKMDPSIGAWAAVTKDGHWSGGVALVRALGLGIAAGGP